MPGIHTLKLEIGYGSFPVCTAQKQITLAAIPDASCTLDAAAYCPENVLMPQPATISADCSYLW
jgi:hypothetical protein